MKILAFWAVTLLLSCHQSEQRTACNIGTMFNDQFFDLEQLYSYEPIDKKEYFTLENKDRLLIYYLSNVSCNTCVHRDIQIVGEFQEAFAPDVAVAILAKVTHDHYVKQLRRVSKIRLPILKVEADHSQNLLADRALFLEIDLIHSKIRSAYVPDPHPDFHKCTVQYLNQFTSKNKL